MEPMRLRPRRAAGHLQRRDRGEPPRDGGGLRAASSRRPTTSRRCRRSSAPRTPSRATPPASASRRSPSSRTRSRTCSTASARARWRSPRRSPPCCSRRWTACASSSGAAIAGHDGLRRDHLDLIERLEATAESADDRRAVLAGQRCTKPTSGARSIGRRWADLEGAFSRSQTLRVDIEKLDRMLNLTGEIAVARERLGDLLDRCVAQPADRSGRRGASRRRSAVPGSAGRGDEDPDGAARPHVPAVLPHRARRGHGAAASRRTLELSGEDVDVDTNVIEHLRDPLTHLVRNAVDHGIETPERAARRRQGSARPGVACRRGTKAARSSSRCRTTAPGSIATRIIARARAIRRSPRPRDACPTASCSG